MTKCKVKDDWLARKDEMGYVLSSWAQKKGDSLILCTVCGTGKTISCEAKGFQAIEQHYKTVTHKTNARTKLGPNQQLLSVVSVCRSEPKSLPPAVPVSLPPTSTLVLTSKKDSAVTMELLWVMKTVISDYSANSCEGVEDLFRAMFGNAVPEDFSLGRTKAGYYITEALGPYFRDKILSDAVKSYFSVHFDETTNAQGAKELQVSIQYWSTEEKQISFKHLETFFIGKQCNHTDKKRYLVRMELFRRMLFFF